MAIGRLARAEPSQSLAYFERVAALRERVGKLSDEIESAYAAAGPHGQQVGSIGGGGGSDAMGVIDRIIDADTMAELERLRPRLRQWLDKASDVLYGRSGRGGVAKRIGTDEADMLLRHYLQGESWASIARSFGASARNLTDWCKCHARSVCRRIDRIGMDTLADS